MNKYKHQSGAQKREKRKIKDLEAAAKDEKQQKLSFFLTTGRCDVAVVNTNAEVAKPDKNLELQESTKGFEKNIDLGCQGGSGKGEENEKSINHEDFTDSDQSDLEPNKKGDQIIMDWADLSGGEEPGLRNGEDCFKLRNDSSVSEKLEFLKIHPFQPTQADGLKSKLDVTQMYFRLVGSSKVKRNWVTVKVESCSKKIEAVFCSICIAFSVSRDSSFCYGCKNLRRIYDSIRVHENSASHINAVKSYMMASRGASIGAKINEDLYVHKKKCCEENVHVLRQIFEVIKLIGRQCLPYRGPGSSETLYKIHEPESNHGNFLEIIKLLAKSDSILGKHLDMAVAQSKKRHDGLQKQGKSSRGRGNLITLLSKTTVNKIIQFTLDTMREKIVAELGDRRFSIQMDSTQDISVNDQATIVVRYVVDGRVHERLFAVLAVRDSTGHGLNELIKDCFEKHGLKYENIAGESFDGASNMRGEVNGLKAQIKNVVKDSVYIWCYAHVLNLCICDCCDNLEAKNLFGLLNRIAVFFSESYKRMNIWCDSASQLPKSKMKKLQKIGETRWWAREKALTWIFLGDDCLYPIVLFALEKIMESNFDSKTISEAEGLHDKLLQYKTILTANIFLAIFREFGPTSRYLQTQNLDLVTAWNMVERSKNALEIMTMDSVLNETNKFVRSMSGKFSELGMDTSIDEKLSSRKRISLKKKMDGENCRDERPRDPMDVFRVEVFNSIKDKIIMALTERFSDNKNLISCMQYLNPRHFSKFENEGPPTEEALSELARLARVETADLQNELLQFSKIFLNMTEQPSSTPHLLTQTIDFGNKGDLKEDSETTKKQSLEEVDDEPIEEIVKGCQKQCNKCVACCYSFLYFYNMQSAAFTNLFITYEYILTLSCTEVSCERAFSKLKLIKNRLRSALSQELLEAFMIMTVEKQLLESIDFNCILDKLKKSSNLFLKMLSY